MNIEIRKAGINDAEAISNIINSVVDEKKFTSLRKFSAAEEREYIDSLGEREAIFLAERDGKVLGFQNISLFAKWSESMSHVGNILTLILKEHRNQGIGGMLAEKTLEFARHNGYEKISTYVIEENVGALKFYESIGFVRCGKWSRQVRIDGKYHDEVVVELFL
jgi:ribosomal protein S18 acetylase RimI-like enzyme